MKRMKLFIHILFHVENTYFIAIRVKEKKYLLGDLFVFQITGHNLIFKFLFLFLVN